MVYYLWMQVWFWGTFVFGLVLGGFCLKAFLHSEKGSTRYKLALASFITVMALAIGSFLIRYLILFFS